MIDKEFIEKINHWRTCPKCGLVDGQVSFEVVKNRGIPAPHKCTDDIKEVVRKDLSPHPIIYILICPNCNEHWGI